jgi:hypothetical protein
MHDDGLGASSRMFSDIALVWEVNHGIRLLPSSVAVQ